MSNMQQQVREHISKQKEVWVLTKNNGQPVMRERARVIETMRAGVKVAIPGKRELTVTFDRIETDTPLQQDAPRARREPEVEVRRARTPVPAAPHTMREQMARVIPIVTTSKPEESDVDVEYKAWVAMGAELVEGIKAKQRKLCEIREGMHADRRALRKELEDHQNEVNSQIADIDELERKLTAQHDEYELALQRIEVQKQRR